MARDFRAFLTHTFYSFLKITHTYYILYVGAVPIRFAFYGQGTGPILLDDVQCLGTETRLIDCPANTLTVHNCAHSEDAGVQCQFGNVYQHYMYSVNRTLLYVSLLQYIRTMIACITQMYSCPWTVIHLCCC